MVASVASSEKKALVEAIVDCIIHKKDIVELHKKIHEMLLRDTVNGKLYKYRSFDRKGYSIKSIKDGTLYCSHPESFNDPFDCKIGITVFDYFERVNPKGSSLIRAVFEKLPKVMDGELDLKDCDDEERSLIEKVLQNNLFHQALNTHKNQSTDALSKDAQSFVAEALKSMILDEKFKDYNGSRVDELCKIVTTITPNNIATVNNSSVRETLAIAFGLSPDADELDIMIKMGQTACPEHLHYFTTARKNLEDINTLSTKNMNKAFRACCLCTSFKNKLMWSHYSNSHTGFCLEYDFSGNDKTALRNLPFPIYYSNARPTIPWENTVDLSTQNSEEAATKLMIGMLAKGDTWEYENEWRILIGGNENPKLKMPKITCIYLGASINQKDRTKILKIAKKKQIPVKQMRIDSGRYELHAEDLLAF